SIEKKGEKGHCQRRFGFTLAEVLVTLGIIGVVSAMTVPSLMQNYQRQSYVVQLHKVYNELSQALLRYQTDKNAVNITEAGLNSTAAVQSFIENYMKVVAKCDKLQSPCFSDSYKTMGGNSFTGHNVDTKTYVLASGAALRPLYTLQGNKIINIGVDINGQKGPNILGRDLFYFAIYKNGLIDDFGAVEDDAPLTEAQRQSVFNLACNKADTGSGWGCLGKIMNDSWQMNY
ncbi:TPA: hypothetical protein CPT81_06775, partial [Candidatus Gastranaerophilales bacterium HUM_20]